DKLMLLYARIAWKYGSALLGLAWGLSTVILIPDYSPPFTISKYNLSVPRRTIRKIRMIGPIANVSSRTRSRKTASNHPPVFACVSGPANDRNHLVTVLQRLLEQLPNNVRVIMGCGNPEGSDQPKTFGRLTVYEWMNQCDYDRVFAEADLIIGRAGHGTIMKAVRERKPLVLIPPPNHTEQANNSKRACEIGIAVELDQGGLEPENFRGAVRDALRKNESWPPELVAASRSQDGAREIVRLVYELGSLGDLPVESPTERSRETVPEPVAR
ncbi:MAG TPA: glycosyltransferase, partial [Candidatus Binatus sp.]|nr:glycosyltransferase [Candidatus Binatus sp.]